VSSHDLRNQARRILRLFKDPDFQFMLGDAQKAAARSDDAAIRETLVDIVARRSMETARTRLALTLNDAAIRAANLTADEYAALSLVYVSRYTVQNGIDSFDKLCDYVNSCMIPFAKLVSREAASFWQIQAQSCGSIETGRFFSGASIPGAICRGPWHRLLEGAA
jgi:hypothetical protein